MEIIDAGCPLGAKCEEPVEKDGKAYLARCPWYTKIQGRNPQSGEEMDRWACAISLLPILLVENSSSTRMCNANIEKLANAVENRPKATLTTLPLKDSQLPKGLQDGK